MSVVGLLIAELTTCRVVQADKRRAFVPIANNYKEEPYLRYYH